MTGLKTLATSSKHRRIAALTLVLLAGTALGGYGIARADETAGLNASAAVQKNFTPVPDFSALVTALKPAVVSITVHLKISDASEQVPDPNDQGGQSGPGGASPFPFPFPMPGFGGGQAPQPQAVEAKGSGFIINSDGTIVTNNHVVKNAKSITVTLSDGQSYPAKVIGADPRTDLAVVKVSAGHPLPFVELGDSRAVIPGEWVIAMGNPFGLSNTVTAGIVSALGRDIGDGPYDRFIQIDAPINEGNSGGPLFDQKGRVIGINTAILSPSGGSVGIGFAIPSDMIKRVVTQLVASGKVTRGYLGVEAQMITPTMAQAMGLPDGQDGAPVGALIAGISPSSPAFRAGLKPGDVITKVDGAPVTNPGDLAIDIANVDPGHDTSIDYLRNGKPHTLTVAVATLPTNPNKDFGTNGASGPDMTAHGDIGLTLAPLTGHDLAQLNLPNGTQGAVVAQVQPGSPADEAGLQSGDLLVGVGNDPITSPDQAAAAIKSAEGKGGKALALRVVRNGEALFVAVKVPDSKKAG
jgi:serine protease Do